MKTSTIKAMTQENKTEDEFIAQFMGGKRCVIYVKSIGNVFGYEFDVDGTADYLTLDELHYKTSYDWLMPVVNRIASLGKIVTIEMFDEENVCQIRHSVDSILADFSGSDKSCCLAVYKAVVDFVKHYNSTRIE